MPSEVVVVGAEEGAPREMDWENDEDDVEDADEEDNKAGPTDEAAERDDHGRSSASSDGETDDDDADDNSEPEAAAADVQDEDHEAASDPNGSSDDNGEEVEEEDEVVVAAAVVLDDDEEEDNMDEDGDDDDDEEVVAETPPPPPPAPKVVAKPRPSAGVASKPATKKAKAATPHPPAAAKKTTPTKTAGGGGGGGGSKTKKKPPPPSAGKPVGGGGGKAAGGGGSAGKPASGNKKPASAASKAKAKAKGPSGGGGGNNNKSNGHHHPQGGDAPRTTTAVVVPAKTLAAARDARALLEEVVHALPLAMEECTVRSLGRLRVNHGGGGGGGVLADHRFGTASSLFPVGFSCDRHEFSPVHGRVLKVNCTILDGSAIRDKQRAMGVPIQRQLRTDGPVFRLLWGPAVDEGPEMFEHPYIPQIHSAPISAEPLAWAVAEAAGGDAHGGRKQRPRVLEPSRGMRVRVRFEKDEHYLGTIVEAVERPTPTPTPPPPPSSGGGGSSSTKKKRKVPKSYRLQIRYDDGSHEDIGYPDPDVALLLPGIENEVDAQGNVELTEINGKPVTCVVASSPIEAWGLALVKLGMVDEVMFEFALEQLKKSRLEAFREAKRRLEGPPAALTPQPGKSRDAGETLSVASHQGAASGASTPVENGANDDAEPSPRAEPPSEREKAFREMTEDLLQDLEAAMEEDHDAAVELADARIQLHGHLLCNPFNSDDQAKSQQASWLATAVRKEKLKMGSTGNKKKLVTALDLLERNDTLYTADIEALIEGLPGSEYCNSYVFKAFRGNAMSNRQWMHEAQLRREKEMMKQVNRQRETDEKLMQECEKLKKRKERDDVRDARKRQKLEEEDQKKRARIDERLSRLKVQVEERLLNEAAFQREKVILLLAKNQAREFSRRRKAAETVAAQAVVEAKESVIQRPVEVTSLPTLSKTYEEDTIRVWNFMTTFGSFFIERGYITEVPTLESLQSAIDTIRSGEGLLLSSTDAVSTLTDLAVAICKPLAASLTRVLFASLIALNPTLQKDFGAAFFNEVNATGGVSNDAEESTTRADVLLPVNPMTWQEVARLSMLADAFGELGYQRHESSHFLRGYRSAGHPNSKEARRLRKTEDIWVAILRQEIELGSSESRSDLRAKLKIEIPCLPLCAVGEFVYHLHCVNSMADPTFQDVRRSIGAALSLVQGSDTEAAQEQKDELLRYLSLVDEHAATAKEPKLPRKLKTKFSQVFDKYAGVASAQYLQDKPNETSWPWVESRSKVGSASAIDLRALPRERMGQLNCLVLSNSDYKQLSQFREQYTENALRLKEEEERKALKDDEEDEDEEEDLDDVEDKADKVAADANVEMSDADLRDASLNEETNGTSDSTSMPEATNGESSVDKELARIGKPTDHDDFCGDKPTAPEPLRRCLAVLRALCNASQASSFLNPIDPQSNPGYYDAVLQPMCLREVGSQLYAAAAAAAQPGADVQHIVENTVLQFGRNVRLIEQNTLCYGNAGPTVISMGSELLRIFERLFLDWVLAPVDLLPPLTDLDDDKCVNPHPSDDESTVLFCDGCEGKYNVNRLVPPLKKVPSGDWYCPRCISGRWWGHLDPRVGKKFTPSGSADIDSAVVMSCSYRYAEPSDAKPTLMYTVEVGPDQTETWSLEKVNEALRASGVVVPPIPFLEAVAESPGYGHGVDLGLRRELVPISANPRISETAAQVSLSSSVFRDTISSAGTLLVIDPEDMTAPEWLRLLVLLTTKCSSSDVIQTVVGKMETAAAESMAAPLESSAKVSSIQDILPDIQGVSSDLELEASDGKNTGDESQVAKSVPMDSLDVSGSGSLSKPGPIQENGGHHTVVVEAVEIVEDMDVEPAVTLSINDHAPDGPPSGNEVAEEVPVYAMALLEKKRRRKTIEDSIAAYCIKTQLRPAVATFEDDRVSQVVDVTLSATVPGLDFASVRCRRKNCDFCGLLDVALGSPLVRVPNQDEWAELMPHTMRNRRVYLVASTPARHSDDSPKLVAVKIRIDGDIFSVPESDLEHIPDGGMLEFAPRADAGFQNELLFRGESDMPFVTGSLSAHECCAVAAHNSRKELLVQSHRDRQAELIEKGAGLKCGRTLEIGHDALGRSYWKFMDDEASLFVHSPDESSTLSRAWLRYDGPARIASVMFAVAKDKVVDDLKHAFPGAAQLLRSGSWKDALMAELYPAALRYSQELASDAMDVDMVAIKAVGGLDPYAEGEDVLVEAKSGTMLWDASVTGVSQRHIGPAQEMVIDAYRVEYKGWNTRFTEWVEPKRVVEPNENNRLLQVELNDERAASRGGLPPSLNMLVAKDYLYVRDRVRGTATLPEFDRIAQVNEGASSSAVTFGLMKAAILAVEAALPLGSVDSSDDGPWSRRFAREWRHMVETATGPARLMQCVILLEDMIGEDWINQEVAYLRSCLPARWKAIHEASSASLAIRIILLDRSLKYGTVDRKRYQSNTKKKANRAKNNSS